MAFSPIPAGTVAVSCTATSSNAALPKACSAVSISNPSANPVAFRFGVDNTVTASFAVAAGAAGDIVVPAGQVKDLSIPPRYTWVAAIALVAGPSIVYVSCGETNS